MNNNTKYIGLTGVARSGKDTMCMALIKELKNNNLIGRRFSIADGLKASLHNFILTEFGIDTFTTSITDKEIIRPMLVEYGLVKRNLSEGKFLTGKLQEIIDSSLAKEPTDVVIVTDIRYDKFPEDEYFWITEKNKGGLVHITKTYEIDRTLKSGSIFAKTLPANEQERLYDPILEKKADYKVCWESKGDFNEETQHYYLPYASEVLKYLNII